MRFPDSERVTYAANPLVEVICQVRFDRLLQLEAEIPVAFQQRLRSSYPQVTEAVTAALPPEIASLAGLGGGSPGGRAFDFVSADNVWKVGLSSQFIALSTRQYSRWEDFKARFLTVLEAFVETYGIKEFTRLGLRYRDLIQRSKMGVGGRPWAELLNASLVGELQVAGFEKDVAHVGKELILALDFDEASVRLFHGFARSLNSEETCYLIDSDFFRDRRTEYSHAEPILDRFNREAGRLFRWAIADPLHAAMEPQRVG